MTFHESRVLEKLRVAQLITKFQAYIWKRLLCRNLQLPKNPAHLIQSKDNTILKSFDLIYFLNMFIVNKPDKKMSCSLWNTKFYDLQKAATGPYP
jgi:hypothetical protein